MNDQQTTQNSQNNNKIMAFLAYIIFFLPLLTTSKNDPFVKYHVKQGLVLFIAEFVVWILGFIPVIGLLSFILFICLFILWIIGILNALNGKQKPLPFIGQFASQFDF